MTDCLERIAPNGFSKSEKPTGFSTANLITPQDFGAVADGITLNTRAIQDAIDFASTSCGAVHFPSGRYLTGTLHLRSNLSITFGAGAILIGSSNIDDYPKLSMSSELLRAQMQRFEFALLIGIGVENVTISGKGTLDGNGVRISDEWTRHHPKIGRECKIDEVLRPTLIYLIEARNCEVSGITLVNPASWTQIYLGCDGLRLENLTVKAISAWNNDGIDICDCQNTTVRGCRINCADDGICLKSSGRLVENVVISDCIVRCSASAVKFGTASEQGFRNIAISNLTIYDTARSGITLQAIDGGTVEYVTISNVTMRNVGNAIYLRIGDRSRKNAFHRNIGQLRWISISNIVAEITGFDADMDYPFRAPRQKPYPNPLPSSIVGHPDSRIEDVMLNNIQLVYRGDISSKDTVLLPENCMEVPECAGDYPEYDQFGELPAWGFYVRHAHRVTFRDVRFHLVGKDSRPPVVAEDASDLRLEGLLFQGSNGTIPVYVHDHLSDADDHK